MILNEHGKPMVRRLGFIGGLQPERTPKDSSLVSLVGFERVSQDWEACEECEKKPA